MFNSEVTFYHRFLQRSHKIHDAGLSQICEVAKLHIFVEPKICVHMSYSGPI